MGWLPLLFTVAGVLGIFLILVILDRKKKS
jgi:hypothetical protein